MTDAKTIIIMPAHNEAANLPMVFEGLRRYAPDLAVVVVDDASIDETSSIAARLGAAVVTLPCNLGYGGAVQTGFKYAVENGYEYAVMMDADGQHDPEYIPSLLAPVIAGEADVAIGSRFLGVMDYQAGWAKRAGMAIFGLIAAHFTGRHVTDPTSGFQALNRKVLRFFARDNYPSDYPDTDTLLLLYYAGLRVVEVPVRIRGRLAGTSMHSSWKVFYYVFKMFLSIFMVLLRQRTHDNAHCLSETDERANDAVERER